MASARRHLPSAHLAEAQFVCFTEDPNGIDDFIETRRRVVEPCVLFPIFFPFWSLIRISLEQLDLKVILTYFNYKSYNILLPYNTFITDAFLHFDLVFWWYGSWDEEPTGRLPLVVGESLPLQRRGHSEKHKRRWRWRERNQNNWDSSLTHVQISYITVIVIIDISNYVYIQYYIIYIQYYVYIYIPSIMYIYIPSIMYIYI